MVVTQLAEGLLSCQRSAVQIQSLGKFYNEYIFTVEKTKTNITEAGNVPFKRGNRKMFLLRFWIFNGEQKFQDLINLSLTSTVATF